MLLRIAHNPANWASNAPICLKCGQHDSSTGMCRLGMHHSAHINANFCPQGDFGPGSNIPPENWPFAEHERVMECRACGHCEKECCMIDAASIRAHSREAVCPIGKYPNGSVGRIEVATQPEIDLPAKGCCS